MKTTTKVFLVIAAIALSATTIITAQSLNNSEPDIYTYTLEKNKSYIFYNDAMDIFTLVGKNDTISEFEQSCIFLGDEPNKALFTLDAMLYLIEDKDTLKTPDKILTYTTIGNKEYLNFKSRDCIGSCNISKKNLIKAENHIEKLITKMMNAPEDRD